MKLHSVLVVVAVLLSCLAAVAFGKTTGHVEKGLGQGKASCSCTGNA